MTPSYLHPAHALARASCIIFDFDGVIADSEEFQLQVWADVFRTRGTKPTAFSVESIAGLLDREAITNLWPDGSELEYDELLALKLKLYRDRAAEVPCVPGIREVLESLHENKKIYICSSSAGELIRRFLSRELDHIDIDGVVGAGDYANFKPHPDPYLTVLERAGVSAEQAVAIEDSPTGVRAARAAKIKVIHFDRYQQGAKSDLVIHSLDELRK